MPIEGGNMAIRSATDVFSEWATKNKDEGMERGHAASVKAMLELAFPNLPTPYTAVDLGCGNGWVCRLLEQREGCSHVVGVDGSEVMIEKAQTLGQGEFHLARLPEWRPEATFDFLHSMEFLYYLEDPAAMLKMIHAEWLNEGGFMVAGVDHYLENEDSHGWPEALDVHMTLLSEAQWKQAMIDAGFSDVGIQRVAAKDDFVGTLVMFGKKDSN